MSKPDGVVPGSVYLFRHGETEWSLSGQHTGTTDLPLLPEGEEAARELREILRNRAFERVLTSPLQRARHTAELAGVTDFEVEPLLREWDYGAYEGITTADISARVGRPWEVFVDGVVAGDTPGETLEDVAARAQQVIDSIWPSDHIISRQPSLDVHCLMALFAARTRSVKMGPSVLSLPPRDPVQVAKIYASLDHLSGGKRRVIMAVGLGSDRRECEVAGVPVAERGARMREGVEILRKLLDDQRAHFKADASAAKKLLGVGDAKVDEALDPAEAAAWACVGNALLNLDATIRR